WIPAPSASGPRRPAFPGSTLPLARREERSGLRPEAESRQLREGPKQEIRRVRRGKQRETLFAEERAQRFQPRRYGRRPLRAGPARQLARNRLAVPAQHR